MHTEKLYWRPRTGHWWDILSEHSDPTRSTALYICACVRACVRACAEVFQAVAGDINRFLYLAVYAYCACSCTVNYIIIVYGTKKKSLS